MIGFACNGLRNYYKDFNQIWYIEIGIKLVPEKIYQGKSLSFHGTAIQESRLDSKITFNEPETLKITLFK